MTEAGDPWRRAAGHPADTRARNLRHRSVAVVVVTGAGDVVAHRPAAWKDVWPGRWDVCFGGVVGVGERWRDAAHRELAEEAGVDVAPDDLRELGRGSYTDNDVSAHARVYLARHDGPFHPADGEVAELALVPLARLDGGSPAGTCARTAPPSWSPCSPAWPRGMPRDATGTAGADPDGPATAPSYRHRCHTREGEVKDRRVGAGESHSV